MPARAWSCRLWLGVAYLLATGLAQCAHHHGAVDEHAATRCLASCDDQRVHLSGHTSVDLGDHQDHCPACQFRTSHQAGRDTHVAPFRPVRAGRVESTHPVLSVRRPTSRLSCRAPPVA